MAYIELPEIISVLSDQSVLEDDDSLMGINAGMEAEDFLQFQQDQSVARARQQEAENLQSQQQVPQHRGLGLQAGGLQQLHQQGLGTQRAPQQHRGQLHQPGQDQTQGRVQQVTQQVPQPVPHPVPQHQGRGAQAGGYQGLQQGLQATGHAHPGPVPKQPPAFDLTDAPPDLAKQCMEMSSWLVDSGLSKKEAMDKSMEWLRKQTLQRSNQQQTQQGQSLTPEMVQLLQGQDSVNRVLAENLTRKAESSLDPLAHT